MQVRTSHPLGATVTGLAIPDATGTDIAALRRLLADHGVVALPGQDVDDREFSGFLRRFGPPAFTAGETPLAGHPDLNEVSNVGRRTPPRSVFHVDTSYVRHPPAYTALRAVTIPERGGDTVFANQYRAHDLLPEALRADLAGRTLRHVVTGVDPADGESSAEHPVLRRHPVSGRTALYVTTPERCGGVSGLDDRGARALVEYLYELSTGEDNLHRHRWAGGDVVVWDNGCVLHRGDHDGVVGERVLHRGMVAAA